MAATKGAGMFERAGNVRGAIGRARHLRREMTASEKSLWEASRALKLQIRRQVPMGRYIADFAHHRSGLVIEVDGARHDLPEEQLHDAERDAWFTSQGYRTLRVRDREAYGDPFAVAERVRLEIQNALSAAKPFPLNGGRVEMGMWPRADSLSSGEGPPLSPPNTETSGIHPQPCPSPIEGEGFCQPDLQTGGQ